MATKTKMQIRFRSNKKKTASGFRCYVDVYGGSAASTTTASSSNTTIAPVTAAPGSCLCGQKGSGMRIVGGVETEANEYPWQVALVSGGVETEANEYPWQV